MAKGYGMMCPVARTLDVVGERWTLLILRDLFVIGPRRFQDLLESLDGIAPTTLSARLKSLEEDGIIERRFYSDHPPRADYGLTEKGRRLGPVLKALRDWGKRYDDTGSASPASANSA
jgi:DNA-binding HxlR family transcriptional regulator